MFVYKKRFSGLIFETPYHKFVWSLPYSSVVLMESITQSSKFHCFMMSKFLFSPPNLTLFILVLYLGQLVKHLLEQVSEQAQKIEIVKLCAVGTRNMVSQEIGTRPEKLQDQRGLIADKQEQLEVCNRSSVINYFCCWHLLFYSWYFCLLIVFMCPLSPLSSCPSIFIVPLELCFLQFATQYVDRNLLKVVPYQLGFVWHVQQKLLLSNSSH